MSAIAGRIARKAIIEDGLPRGESSGVRFAIEEVEIVLAEEEIRTVNRIGIGTRRGNRYVLNSDRIGAGAASIVIGRVNEQVKRNIQREEIHLRAVKRCGTGC